MENKLLRIALFLSIFIILFAGFNYLMAPKNNTSAAGIHDAFAKGFLAEPDDSVDVLFLGDSEVYCCVAPLVIWEEYGITSYACGTSDQALYQTESFLYRAFDKQNPKIVFLESNILYRDHSTLDVIPHWMGEVFPLIRYHDRWKSLTQSDFGPVSYTNIVRDKGYLYKTDINPADTANYMIPSEDVSPIPGKNVQHVKNILEFCQKHGAEFVIFSSPSTINGTWVRHNAIVQLTQQLGIAYIDMNLLSDDVPIDWETDTLDSGDHLNYDGAVKVSRYLGEYLMQKQFFEDKRTFPDFCSWNEALIEFKTTLS